MPLASKKNHVLPRPGAMRIVSQSMGRQQAGPDLEHLEHVDARVVEQPAVVVRSTGKAARWHRRWRGTTPVVSATAVRTQLGEDAYRIQIQRLGKRATVVSPKTISMADAVAVMTGAIKVPPSSQELPPPG